MAWSIAAALLTPSIDNVYVSTDSEEYAEVARKYGALIPFLRPPQISGDNSTDTEFMLHFLRWAEDNGAFPDYIVHLRATTPARSPAIIEEGIQKFISVSDATSLCSAHSVEYPPCKYFKLNADNTFSGYMGEEFVNQPRQLCEQAYQSNGYVDVLDAKNILKTGHLHGCKRLAFITPFPGEIDLEEDFIAAEMLTGELAGELKCYLDGISAGRLDAS